ncbi:MAG: cell division protein FtsQ/DivIB [Gammaproteobacteria bacterium]|nr:cell division protein FtsQ/DivIB [Gammaproteobacteria bacterium]
MNRVLLLRFGGSVELRRGATRRGAAARATHARSRWMVPALFAVLLLAAGQLGWKALQEVANVPIKQVSVNGDFRFLDKARVEEIMLPHLGTGYFMVDLPRIRDELRALPLVHEVIVRRAWPDRLLVFITEQVPVLRFGEQGYLNPYGEVFEPGAPLADTGLPLVDGPPGSGKLLLGRFDEFTEMLEPTGLRIRSLLLDGKHAWRMELSNGCVVLLGRRDVPNKARMLASLLSGEWAGEHERISRIDMRYSNGVAVVWEGTPGRSGNAGVAAATGRP